MLVHTQESAPHTFQTVASGAVERIATEPLPAAADAAVRKKAQAAGVAAALYLVDAL